MEWCSIVGLCKEENGSQRRRSSLSGGNFGQSMQRGRAAEENGGVQRLRREWIGFRPNLGGSSVMSM
ncbi:hypothetical protein AAC387_Pa04g0821 [Persea americana]